MLFLLKISRIKVLVKHQTTENKVKLAVEQRGSLQNGYFSQEPAEAKTEIRDRGILPLSTVDFVNF